MPISKCLVTHTRRQCFELHAADRNAELCDAPRAGYRQDQGLRLQCWTAMTRSLEDGAAPMDNNAVEHQIRPWTLNAQRVFAGH
ncbi:transposase [Pseudomonas koreensis]|nr:transposase [Pseudomonas koreensis]MBP3998195.1 transposase [Pseudomonas koreensis]MBP4000959.1 transposase [Pseudomonas koreensis]